MCLAVAHMQPLCALLCRVPVNAGVKELHQQAGSGRHQRKKNSSHWCSNSRHTTSSHGAHVSQCHL